VLLTVHTVLGQVLAKLVDGVLDPGLHTVSFDAGGHPSGAYLYTIRAGGYTKTRILTVLR
jgi:hypothetical protein